MTALTLDACPVERWAIRTSGFRTAGRPNHLGVDFGTPNHAVWPILRARIFAPWAGRVTIGYQAGGAGNWIWVERADGVLFKCFHLDSFAKRTGDWVEAGEVIGYVDNTGASQGSHYHVEIWIDGQPVDCADAIFASQTFVTDPFPPGTPPSTEDWFDMATEADLINAIKSDDVQWTIARSVAGFMYGEDLTGASGPSTNLPRLFTDQDARIALALAVTQKRIIDAVNAAQAGEPVNAEEFAEAVVDEIRERLASARPLAGGEG